MVKEETVKRYRILKFFYKNILKRAFMFFIIGVLIVYVFKSIRGDLLTYIILFMICLGINLFSFFLKTDIKKEFYGDN